MGRNRIHFTMEDTDELKKSKEVWIYLDVQKALDGRVTIIQIRSQGYPMSRESQRGNSA